MIYKLKEPIVFDDRQITELNFREKIRAGDVRAMPADSKEMTNGHFLTLAGKLCAQTDLVMNQLSFDDYSEVCTIVVNFMNPGRATG